MDKEEQKKFIRQCFENYYNFCEKTDDQILMRESKRLSNLDKDDYGVPEEMEYGEATEEFYVKWRLIPSTLREEQLAKIEQELNIKFPSLYKVFLTTYYHMFDWIVPAQTGDNPLEFLNEINPILLKFGYLSFTCDDEQGRIIFIDTNNLPEEEKCCIYEIEHEFFYNFEEDEITREDIEKEMTMIYSDFKSFLEDKFLNI